MSLIKLNIPDTLNLKNFDFSIYLASKMYQDGLVTVGQGAEIVGVSKRTFIEILGKYGVSLFSLSKEDLENDISNA
ncbi:MAG: UPF0175 family protein [Bacteroidota bacterium]